MTNFNMKNISFGVVVVLGIFFHTLAFHADAAQAPAAQPNNFCTGGTDVTQEIKDLCTNVVGAAKTWEEAALASVKHLSTDAIKAMKPLITTIDQKLVKSIAISDRAQIVQICKDGYQQATDGLKKCPNLITVGPFTDYESTLTSIYTAIEDCKNAIIDEKGQTEIPEVTKFTTDIRKLADVALVIAKKDPRVAQYGASLAKGDFKDSAGDPSLIGPISNTFYGATPN
ncbi:hypothetical protein LIER_18211 [Lithospermum erythrorhizon]|uniref:Pectinesterase inhibitor domain-containing protein n=1 Tax=Lithospermum erythrorhizon TaxID=34254 RepID=A0AAV3QD45_LITER